MRILVVGHLVPWPANFGGRMRLANVIQALRPLGTVEAFVVARDGGHPKGAADPGVVGRLAVTPFPGFALSNVRRLTWFARSKLPLELTGRDFSAVRSAFGDFVRDESYDLVWVSRLETLVAIGDLLNGPTILDLDDLRDSWSASRLGSRADDGLYRGISGSLKTAQAHRNASAWSTLQQRAARSVDAVVVCSDADRAKLDWPNLRVIPNGYDRPERPLGRTNVGSPPTILFQGSLTYAPNVDGATYLANRVAPLLRERLPGVQVRLVGRSAPDVMQLMNAPEVVVTGFVPSIDSELELADLVAVPIRFGGGTRIKVLEAFAHRIPVVSTSSGAYGLDVVGGRHLLIADTPEAFADACGELLSNDDRRRRLVDEAEQLFLERYQWCRLAEPIRELARSVA